MASVQAIDGWGNRIGWRFTTPLAFVVAIGTLVRLSLLGHVLRNDEVLTVTRFAVDLGTAISDYSAPNNHILHSVLVHLSTSVLGLDPWAIRLPALVFGVGLIVAVDWWISSATGRRSAGLFAAALVAGSSMLIEYSTVARGYSMVAVGFVLLLEISRRLLHEQSLRLWAGWVAAAVAGLVTVPLFAFPLSTVGAWLLLTAIFRRKGQSRRIVTQAASSVLAVGALTVIAYAPAAIATGVGSIVDNPFVKSVSWSELPGDWYRLTVNLAVLVWRDGVAAVIYSVLFISAIPLNRKIFGRVLTPAVGLLGPLVLVLGLRVAPPQRVWLFVWPLVLGMAGATLGYLLNRYVSQPGERRFVVPTIAISIASLMGLATLASGDVLHSREGGAFHDAPEAADILLGDIEEGDRIVVESHPRVVLDYYLSPDRRSDPLLRRDFENADRVFVVIYRPRPQDLDGVLDQAGLPRVEFSNPVLRWSLPETDIYMMERID